MVSMLFFAKTHGEAAGAAVEFQGVYAARVEAQAARVGLAVWHPCPVVSLILGFYVWRAPGVTCSREEDAVPVGAGDIQAFLLVVPDAFAFFEELHHGGGFWKQFSEGIHGLVKGVVTGVVDFGVFINIDGIEGLVHISEISWERVGAPAEFVKVGDEVEAKIIAIDKERLSLSMKQLSEDPWLSEVAGLDKGSVVEGTITRITPFGAFVQISPAVEALVHVSELGEGSDVDPEKIFTLNERKNFKVIDIDKENRKISLAIDK